MCTHVVQYGEGKEEETVMRYNTVIFDLDGTLLDTLDDLAAAVNHALGELGFPLRSRDEVRQFVGNGVAKLMERALPAGANPADAARALTMSNKFDGAVEPLMEDYFPGLLDLSAGEDEDHGVPKKPHPAMVLRVMETLGADPGTTVYVGDSDVDVETAQNAALPCISVTWGFRTRDFLTQHGAAALASTPGELLTLIE